MNGAVRIILENINFIPFSKMLPHLKEKKKLKLAKDSFYGILESLVSKSEISIRYSKMSVSFETDKSAGTLLTKKDSKNGKRNREDG